jgi:anti-sigma B factor antagonist
MTQSTTHMSVRRLSNASIIEIRGDVTGFAEEALMAAYAEATRDTPQAVILDFTQLDYMNSTGIGLLVTLLIRAQRQQQRLMAYGLSSHYKQIFDLTRLNEAIGIFDTEAAALESVALPQS